MATTDDDTTGFSFGARVAGGFLVVLVVVAIVLAVVFSTDDDDQGAAPAPTAVPTSTAAPTGAAVDGCGFAAADTTAPATAPATEWTLLPNGIAAPTSTTAGPARSGDGVARCYAQSPAGALFAAGQFLAQVADPVLLANVIDQLCAPGPGRDILEQLAATDPQAITGSGSGYQIAGFVFVSVSTDLVALQVALSADGGLVAVPLTLTWSGDWQVEVPVDGNLTASAQPIQTLAGFIPWAGAS